MLARLGNCSSILKVILNFYRILAWQFCVGECMICVCVCVCLFLCFNILSHPSESSDHLASDEKFVVHIFFFFNVVYHFLCCF